MTSLKDESASSSPPAAPQMRRQGCGYDVLERWRELEKNVKYPYETHLDVRFPALDVVNVPAMVRGLDARPKTEGGHFRGWFNQTLCKVNDSVVRLGVMTGEYHWHKHDDLDEFFFVLEGKFLIDLEDGTVELEANQGFVVPKGVVHRTRAPQRCVVLMVEGEAIVPEGDE